MQKEFEEASFALQPGEVSQVIETASGLHIIERYVPFFFSPHPLRNQFSGSPAFPPLFFAKAKRSSRSVSVAYMPAPDLFRKQNPCVRPNFVAPLCWIPCRTDTFFVRLE